MNKSLDVEQRRAAYQRGRWAEQAALCYLQRQGLNLLHRNYRTPFGEIDLVMRDNDVLVLVEVRYRARSDFGTAIESINHAKCLRILKCSEYYLRQQRYQADVQRRLDVVVISGPQGRHETDWLQHVHEM